MTKTRAPSPNLTDSAAGAFTATYDADGHMTEQLLPDGLAQKIGYDAALFAIAAALLMLTGRS
jgi:YD repeat-containing protein